MRILALAFACSLIGCVDDLGTDSDPDQDSSDNVDPTTDDNTGNRPDTTTGKCDTGDRLPGGVTNVSRKKADGNCF